MLRYAAATAFCATFGLPATAACVGDSFFDLMTDDQRATLSASIADMPYAEGLMWTATKGRDTLTIIGTMHIYDSRLEVLRSKASVAVQSADLVMLEATPAEEKALQDLVVSQPDLLFITDGPTLPERLDEETWQLVSEAASQRGIPGFMAAKMQPWYLSLTLAIPVCAIGDMVSGISGLDKMITEDALAAGVPLQAVEPVTTLFELFDGQSIEEQVDMLRVNMIAPDLQEQMFVAMLDLYFAEDVGRLWDMSRIAIAQMPDIDPADGDAMFDEMQAALLDKRNQAWIPVITDATQVNDNIVVAVGAAHLIGEQGVLQLLENGGWAITRKP